MWREGGVLAVEALQAGAAITDEQSCVCTWSGVRWQKCQERKLQKCLHTRTDNKQVYRAGIAGRGCFKECAQGILTYPVNPPPSPLHTLTHPPLCTLLPLWVTWQPESRCTGPGRDQAAEKSWPASAHTWQRSLGQHHHGCPGSVLTEQSKLCYQCVTSVFHMALETAPALTGTDS